MIEKILERGFKQPTHENEFIKENWTIRIYKDRLEAFNNPDLEPGIHYTSPIKKVDIETLLDEIDDKIEKFTIL